MTRYSFIFYWREQSDKSRTFGVKIHINAQTGKVNDKCQVMKIKEDSLFKISFLFVECKCLKILFSLTVVSEWADAVKVCL